jgi:hypothetical protein
MIRFLGIDPGLVSGLVSFYVDEDGTIGSVEHYQLDHIGTAAYFEGCREIWKRNGGPIDTVVAMESFIITPGTAKKTQAPWSLETIGAVRYFVETSGLSLRMSAPSAHKKLVSDAVLKSAGLYFRGEGHATDAARVAVHVAMVDHKLLREHLKGEDD